MTKKTRMLYCIDYSLKNNDDDNGTSAHCIFQQRIKNEKKDEKQEICMMLSEYS